MRTQNLAFIDVETTGFDPNKHEIIELAVVLCKQIDRENEGANIEVIKEYEWKIKMERPEDADEGALRVNHYNETDWLFAIDLKSAMIEFAKVTEGAVFVSHNLTFDYSFVSKAFEKTGVDNKMYFGKLDTISIAFARLYDVKQPFTFSLKSLCELFKIENSKAHSALADTKALVAIYKKMFGLR